MTAPITPEERAKLSRLCRRMPQWRKFAELLAELKPPLEAYQLAGSLPHRGNATRLARRPEVRAYVDELMEEAAEFAGVRRTAVVVRIDRVGRANACDFYQDDGKTLRNIKDLPRELTEAIKSLKRNDDGSIDVELHDKNQANFALLKMLGGIPDPEPAPVRSTMNFFNALPIDDQIALAALLEALPGSPKLVGGETARERSAA